MTDPLREQMKNEALGENEFNEALHERTMRAIRREQVVKEAAPTALWWKWPAALAAMLALAAGVWFLRPEATQPPRQVALAPAPEFRLPNPNAAAVLNQTVRPVQSMVSDIRPAFHDLRDDAHSLGRYLVRQLPTIPEPQQQM